MAGIWTEVTALGQILLIDITLAGDNAVVVGLAASTVPREKRQQVIIGGIAVAVLLRLGLAAMARQLLTIVGLTLSGGILLLWVAWKLFRQIRSHSSQPDPARAPQSVGKAIVHVAVADLSMSLDNVLAVAGAATGHPGWVLAGGLGMAVILMAFASSLVAKLLHRLPWISYLGLGIVVFVASRMIWIGSGEVMRSWLPA